VRLIIASLVVFSVIILFLFALFPADISVTRVIQINRSAKQVRKKISDLREWESWNELIRSVKSVNQTDSPVVQDSSQIRRGYFTVHLLKALPDTVITRWQFQKKMFISNYNLSERSGGVILEWTLHFKVKWYPWEKLSRMFYDKELGPLMENSLLNLRRDLESSPN
jgi:hypothetical protein